MAYKGSFYYDEDYDLGEDYQYEDNLPSYDLNQVFSCIFMVLKQLTSQFLYLFAINLAYRVIRQTAALPEFFKHLSSSLLGYLSTFIFFSTGNHYVWILAGLSYGFTFLCIQIFGIGEKKKGFAMIALQIITIFTCELIEWDTSIWHHLRGSALVISMKAISIAFDVVSKKIPKLPPIYEYFGYQLCPANLVIGPFVSFSCYKTISKGLKFQCMQTLQIMLNSLLSIFFILLSTCVLNYLISDNASFFVTYRDAMVFRTSHYFISFMAASTLQVSGLELVSNSKWLGYQITRPFDIEFPRSLVPVVVSWNIPIHLWIKTYVFENIKQYGKFNAVFLTYLISSALHGLNLHLAAVLLSIGIFSFIEFRLRNALAEILSCCIAARRCREDPKSGVCLTKGHENTSTKYWVKLINFFFGLLTVILLAYLGVLLDTSSTEHGNNSLKKWADLNYFGHLIALIMLIIYLILK